MRKVIEGEEDEEDEEDLVDALTLAPPDIPEKVTQIFSSLVRHQSYRHIVIDESVETDWNLAVVFDAEQGLAFTFRGSLHLSGGEMGRCSASTFSPPDT